MLTCFRRDQNTSKGQAGPAVPWAPSLNPTPWGIPGGNRTREIARQGRWQELRKRSLPELTGDRPPVTGVFQGSSLRPFSPKTATRKSVSLALLTSEKTNARASPSTQSSPSMTIPLSASLRLSRECWTSRDTSAPTKRMKPQVHLVWRSWSSKAKKLQDPFTQLAVSTAHILSVNYIV